METAITRKNNNYWQALSVVSIFIAYFVGQYFAISLSLLMLKYQLPKVINTLVTSLTPLIFLLAGVVITAAASGKYRTFLKLCRFRKWRWFYIPETIGLEIFFLAFSTSFAITMLRFKKLFPAIFDFLEKISNSPFIYLKKTDWVTFAIIAAVAVIVAPIVEEIVFRAVMFNGLKKYINKYSAAVITSLVFAAFHFNIIQFIPLFFLGLIFQFLYITHKSIFPGMVYHALHNGVAMIFLFLIKFYNLDISI